jgi:hypothetical protein
MADTTPSQPDPGSQPGSGNGAEPAGQAPARGAGRSRPVRQYRPSRGRRVGDAIIGVFARAGLVPSTYLLTTRGRKTGRMSRVPWNFGGGPDVRQAASTTS